MCVLSLLLLVVMLMFCSISTAEEEDVQIDDVGTDCKHEVSLTVARAAGRGQLATDALTSVLHHTNYWQHRQRGMKRPAGVPMHLGW